MYKNNIKTQIENVVKEINAFKKKVLNYEDDKKGIINSIDFTQEAKKSKLEELEKSFVQKNKDVYDSINQILTGLNDLVMEANKTALNVTDEKLIKTIEFINAVRQNITDELLNDLIKPFIGNQKALVLLKNMLNTNKVNISLKLLDKYIEAVEPKIKYVDNAMYFAIRDFNNSAANIEKALDTLGEISEILGVQIELNTEE